MSEPLFLNPEEVEFLTNQYGQHLIECENVECRTKYFKCPGYYCIPFRYVCNGLWECPGGTEENNCYIRSCPGYFKCLNSVICIYPESLCDGIIDCPHGDDISFCDMNLPCSCLLYSLSCKNAPDFTSWFEKHDNLSFKPYCIQQS